MDTLTMGKFSPNFNYKSVATLRVVGSRVVEQRHVITFRKLSHIQLVLIFDQIVSNKAKH